MHVKGSIAKKFSFEKMNGQKDYEYAQDVRTGKSVLLVRFVAYDINVDRSVAQHFIAYDVEMQKSCDAYDALDIEWEEIILTSDFGPELSYVLLKGHSFA